MVDSAQLSGEQKLFTKILDEVPYLKPLWSMEDRVYKPDVAEQFLSVASHGEAIMARFALSVWSGENCFNFDIIDAASTLGEKERAIIAHWICEPFWP